MKTCVIAANFFKHKKYTHTKLLSFRFKWIGEAKEKVDKLNKKQKPKNTHNLTIRYEVCETEE